MKYFPTTFILKKKHVLRKCNNENQEMEMNQKQDRVLDHQELTTKPHVEMKESLE